MRALSWMQVRIPHLATTLAVATFCVATIQAAFAGSNGCTGKATSPTYPGGVGTWTVVCGGVCSTGEFCIPIAYPNGGGGTMEGCYCDPTPLQPGSGDESSRIDVLCTFQLIRNPGVLPYALCIRQQCASPCSEWSGLVIEGSESHGEQKCVCP